MQFDLTDPLLPSRLESALVERGWRVASERDGYYKRLVPIEEVRGRDSLLIPTNPEMEDFEDLLLEAWERVASRLADDSSTDLGSVLARPVVDDVFRFAKESDLPSGQISWDAGEALIGSMRMSLLSSAKATLDSAAYFGHRHTGFAGRFLDSVRMGQTERGSFIVTAHARANAVIPAPKPALPSQVVPIITVGDVSRTLVRALSATRASIDAARKNNNGVEVFRDAIGEGVSKDLLAAVKLAAGSAGLISTAVTRAESVRDSIRPEVVYFEHDDYGLIEKAEAYLAGAFPKVNVAITGRVNVVSRPSLGKPGIVSVVVDSGSKATRVKVRLMDSQFSVATQAIAEERFLKVHGTQEQDGATYWIYSPHVEIAEKIPAPVRPES